MITGIVVLGSAVFAVLFSAAWLAFPGLRSRIERPKYRFLANTQSHDSLRRRRSI